MNGPGLHAMRTVLGRPAMTAYGWGAYSALQLLIPLHQRLACAVNGVLPALTPTTSRPHASRLSPHS